MSDTNPAESLDAEGIPEVEDKPPGIDIETEQEGLVAPRDHPIASGGDPAYAVTEAEQRVPEGVAERAKRETPDVGAEELDVGGGVPRANPARAADGTSGELVADPDERGELIAGGVEDAEAHPSPEESAVEVVDDRRL